MGNFIINSVLWTFALYGLFELIKQIIYMCTYTNLKEDGIYVIIAVKNQEEKIEGFLRSIMFKILYGKEEEIKDIIVTDLNSKDKTKEIIEKIRPFLINDGGDVEFVKFENGTAYVKMVGNCANCLYSDLTMSETIETILTSEIPEVIKVEEYRD